MKIHFIVFLFLGGFAFLKTINAEHKIPH